VPVSVKPCDRFGRLALVAGALVLGGFTGEAVADATITFRYPAYTPTSVRIAPGQSVTWTGEAGSTFDTLTGHPLQFADPAIAPQADRSTSTKRTFATVGRFAFSCRLHAQFNMTGAVFVTANQPPAAHFNAPSSAPTGVPVAFDASGSSDPDPGQSLSYAWDFDGDGTTDPSTGPAASFAYPQPGTYTVQLRVTDTNAEPGIGPESSSATRSITIGSGSGSGGHGESGPGGGATPAGGDADRDPDMIAVSVAGSTRLGVVRTRGLVVRVTNSEAAHATATLTVGSRVIGRATAKLRARGPRTIRISLNRRGRALLAHKKRVRAQLRIVLDDADATGTTTTRIVTLRR